MSSADAAAELPERLRGDRRKQPRRPFGFDLQSLAWLSGPSDFLAFDGPRGREISVDDRVAPDAAPRLGAPRATVRTSAPGSCCAASPLPRAAS